MHSMAPRPCFFMCSRARSVRYFFNRSQLMRCCQSNPAMPKFAVPMDPSRREPRGIAVGENPSRVAPCCRNNMFGEGTSAFLIAGVIERFEAEVVRIPGQLASWPGSALRPAAWIGDNPPLTCCHQHGEELRRLGRARGARARAEAHAERTPSLAGSRSCTFYGTEGGWDRLQELVEAHEDAKARRQAFVERIAPAVRNIHAYWLTRCRPYSKIYKS